MEAQLDIEVGVPVASAMPGDGRICAGVLPAGRYASLIYTGIDNGIEANAALLGWGKEQGLLWDTWEANSSIDKLKQMFYTNIVCESLHMTN